MKERVIKQSVEWSFVITTNDVMRKRKEATINILCHHALASPVHMALVAILPE